MSNKIARAGTAGICNHMALSTQLVIMLAFTGYCMLLQAIACFYRLLHAFTGYCMLLLAMACFYRLLHALQAMACFYRLLHAFTGFCMLLLAIACFCSLLQAFACYAGQVCMLAFVSTFQTRQWCTHVSLTYNFAMFSYLITFYANISS